MGQFIHDNFLLNTETAKKLYHEYAAPCPIIDFHCHLSPEDIAQDRRFNNLFEIWLEGDHYKWRAMRANGIDERYCTGDASAFDKFLAWARTVPYTLRNPLYHWTHLELKRYFDIDETLNERNAAAIWDRANSLLKTGDLTTLGILREFNVAALCTTDDPVGDLSHHKVIASLGQPTRVYPTFRPDKALQVESPSAFNVWVDRLATASAIDIRNFASFLEALKSRHDQFDLMGCRLSDHGLSHCYVDSCSESAAAAIFTKVRSGTPADSVEHSRFASFMMLFFGTLHAEKGWTMELHLGARRNNNTRMMKEVGPDSGFDSIADWPQADYLAQYLDLLNQENALPKTIIYNNNPSDNYVFAAMTGNFPGSSMPSKVQFGSGWWFLDQKDGIEAQLNALSNTGLFSRFVGMVTDSRSFMAYPRHEYFRRVLCDLLGREMEQGELPNDEELVGSMIRDICFENAKRYLGLAVADEHELGIIDPDCEGAVSP